MATVPSIRIYPMSSKLAGFVDREIADVQRRLFLRDLPKSNGRWPYQSAGLSAPPGSLVLFQFRARIIASAIFRTTSAFRVRVAATRACCTLTRRRSKHSLRSMLTGCE